MIVLYIFVLIYFIFNITSIVNVFMLSIEKKIIIISLSYKGQQMNLKHNLLVKEKTLINGYPLYFQ